MLSVLKIKYFKATHCIFHFPKSRSYILKNLGTIRNSLKSANCRSISRFSLYIFCSHSPVYFIILVALATVNRNCHQSEMLLFISAAHVSVGTCISHTYNGSKKEQLGQRGWGVSLTGDIQETSGYNPVQCTLCLSRELGPDDPLGSLPTRPIL